MKPIIRWSRRRKAPPRDPPPHWEGRAGTPGAENDERLPDEVRALARRFHEWFEGAPSDAAPYWLPAEVLSQRMSGHMSNEWSVRWIFGMADGDEFLEFYARHRMTNDRRVRMYFNGETRSMPAPTDGGAGVIGLATTDADRILREELRQLGLLP